MAARAAEAESPTQDSGPASGRFEPLTYPADFADSMPRIIRQPRVEGRHLNIEAALMPWRTATSSPGHGRTTFRSRCASPGRVG